MTTLPALPKCPATSADCIESRARVRKARGDVHTARAAVEYKLSDADFSLALKLRSNAPPPAPPPSPPPSPPPAPPPSPPPVATTDANAARFLLRASLSASDAGIASVKAMGQSGWLDAQMDAPIAQTGLQWLAAKGYSSVTIEEHYGNNALGDYMIWNQLISDTNAVRKRAAFALSQFFVVSISGINPLWPAQAIARYWDILNEHAFGNFRDLLEDVTLCYAMGEYLSTKGNRKDGDGKQPDQNYAREIMQLFTIGLYLLNNDGTRKLVNGAPVETYTQDDVIGLARVFTGYDADGTNKVGTDSVRYPGNGIGPIDGVVKPMTADTNKWYWNYNDNEHSMLEKRFLGTVIPANTGAAPSLKIALDALFNHPNVGPFLGKQMIQRFVTSNPSPAYVDRVAKAFNDNGAGVRGDMRAMFKAILLDHEAGNKLREPALRFVQWAKTFGATSASGKTGNLADGLGQSPLRSPSVFNFFRPGYVPANTAIADASLVAPEFQIVNEVTTAAYVNFMQSAIANGVGHLMPNYDLDLTLEKLCLLLTGDQISDATKATIKTAMDAQPGALAKLHTGILLIMASPDYLVQK